MKQKASYIVILTLLVDTSSLAQDTLSLPELLLGLQRHSALFGISPATDSAYTLRKSNIKVNYLPRISFNAEAKWQSDVTSVNASIPGVSLPSPGKDSYDFTVDVSQLIWDSGTTSARLKVEEDSRLLEQNKVETEIYSLKEKVVGLFFALNSVDIAIQQLQIMADELDKRIAELQAGVNAGAILGSSLIALQAEKLRLWQNIDANQAQRESAVESLNLLTGVSIPKSAHFILPQLPVPTEFQCVRPDYKTFDIQAEYLSSTSTLTSKRRYPTLAAFARAGYGRPGLNMLSDEFDTYTLVGARLSWNIWDWSSTSRDRQNLRIQQNVTDYHRRAFTDGYNAQVKSSLSQINSLQKQIKSDEQIVALLEKSALASYSQLRNGVITSASYLSDFNSLLRARIDMNLRKIELEHEIVSLYYTVGLEIE